MEILDFDLNRESSFSSLRGSKEALLGVPGRSFYEVLRFEKRKKNDDFFFFSADRIFEKSENLGFSKKNLGIFEKSKILNLRKFCFFLRFFFGASRQFG